MKNLQCLQSEGPRNWLFQEGACFPLFFSDSDDGRDTITLVEAVGQIIFVQMAEGRQSIQSNIILEIFVYVFLYAFAFIIASDI